MHVRVDRGGRTSSGWRVWIHVLLTTAILEAFPGEGRTLTDTPIETQAINVTVIEGKTAILPCSFPFLGQQKFKVVWADQWSTILTLQEARVIDDERIHVERTFGNEWNLHIERVKYGDQGIYTCHANTQPSYSYTIHLTVVVPPRFTTDEAVGDLIVREGSKAELVCNASGIPSPTITWSRKPQTVGQRTERIGEAGQVLVIHNVTRYCGGTYECVAENGVPPSVRREVNVRVQFEPEINLPNQRMGQFVGKDTVLECVVSAYPQAVTMWKFRGQPITNSDKYGVTLYQEPSTTIVTLSLFIRNLEQSDFGKYSCIASNSLGETSKKMTLYEYYERTKPTSTTTTTVATTTPASTTTTEAQAQRESMRRTHVPLADRRVDELEGREGQGSKDSSSKTWGVTGSCPHNVPSSFVQLLLLTATLCLLFTEL
ncbi:limbic system-associated membrane protein-like isoform X2 [Pomacea canaliculata]|uniref:limbic system-associated membrane protein-like isoform X2 n=1 Tax=Pomacea canaliculata TaxID=400727 RepID=UPI000D72CF63|nr:limbic system-associated membrane protein-like isoform X2 [Pomacea canaliculata]